MSRPTLEVIVMAAEELKNVNMMGKMSVYAVTWVQPTLKQTTRILHKAGKNPVWNDDFSFPIDDHVLLYPHSAVTIQVFSTGTLSPNLVGTAYLPLTDIARMKATKADSEEGDIVTLPLHRPSGRTQGIIRLSVHLAGASIQQMMYALDKGQKGWALEMPSSLSSSIADRIPVMGFPAPGQNYGRSASFFSPSYSSYYSLGTYPSAPPESLATSSSIEGNPIITPPPPRPPPAVPYYPSGNLNLDTSPFVRARNQYVPVQARRRRQGRDNFLLGLIGGAIGGFLLGDIIGGAL